MVCAYAPSIIRVRPYQLAMALHARGHQVDLAFPLASRRDHEDARQLEAQGFRLITRGLTALRRGISLAGALIGGLPLQARYSWSPALMGALGEAVRDADSSGNPYDAAHVEHLRGSPYALPLAGRLPLVWDAVDSITDLFVQASRQAPQSRQRWAARLELERTRREEGRLVNRLPAVSVTAETDRAALTALGLRHRQRGGSSAGAAEIRVIPNGVDLERFAPGPSPGRQAECLVFSGKLGYHANEAAALHLVRSIMPRVWEQRPKTRLILAGAQAPSSLHRLAAADERIELTGYVDDLREPLLRARLAVAPMIYGVGIQNKLLEAMACARPVVASPAAARAVEARPGREIMVGADASELAAHILELLEHPERADEVGRAGRAYVERAHTWDLAARRFEDFYAEAARTLPA